MHYSSGILKQIGKIEYFIPNFLPSPDKNNYFTNESSVIFGNTMFELGKLSEIWFSYEKLQKYLMRSITIKEIIYSTTYNHVGNRMQIFLDLLSISDSDNMIIEYYQELSSLSLDAAISNNIKLQIIDHEILIKLHHKLTKKANNIISKKCNTYDEEFSKNVKNILDFNIFSNYRNQSLRVDKFIPPHPSYIIPLMDNLIKYINSSHEIPHLIIAIISQAQFEMIHPFINENTRTSFLIFLSILINKGVIPATLIPINYYMLKVRTGYCMHLDKIIKNADYKGWVQFILENIFEVASSTYKILKELILLYYELEQIIEKNDNFFKMRSTAKDIIDTLFFTPVININTLSVRIKKSYNATYNILEIFMKLGIIRQINNNKRNRIYVFQNYLELLKIL